MQILTDNPTKKDHFGFDQYVEILVNILNEAENLPLTIGIFGEWGTGKTSLMLMIDEQLKKEEIEEIKTIWFNPWRYDQKEELWSAFIKSILYEIANFSRGKVKRKAKKLAKVISWMAFKKGLSTITSGFISNKDIEQVREDFRKEDQLFYRHVNKFEEDIKEVVSLYLGDKSKSLVVFIDDLDRCLPENAITILESIKLFIGSAKCIFLIAVDRLIIEQGILERYGDKIQISGRDYLEKIIQIPFYLPPIQFDDIKDALNLEDDEIFTNNIMKLMEYGLGGNPRKTKRFVNIYRIILNLLKPSSIEGRNSEGLIDFELNEEDQNFYLAKLLILQILFPDFYGYLKVSPNKLSYLERILTDSELKKEEMEKIEEDSKIIDFLKMSNLTNFLINSSSKKNKKFPVPATEVIVRNLINTFGLFIDDSSSSGEDYMQTDTTGPAYKKK